MCKNRSIFCAIVGFVALSVSSLSFGMAHEHEIFDAIMKCDAKHVQEIVDKEFIDAKCVNYYGQTPLHFAFEAGNEAIVKILLNNEKIGSSLEDFEPSINCVDNRGNTPLHTACCFSDLWIVKLLIDNGAKDSINIANEKLETPFFLLGYRFRDFEKADLLLKNDGYLSMPGLCIACENNDIDRVKLLLANVAKGSVNIVLNKELYWAYENNSPEMFKLLLEYGAKESVNKVYIYGQTILYIACEKSDIEMVKLLLKWGANINIANESGKTLLHRACEKNNIEMVKLLLKWGANINIADERGNTPLHCACSNYSDTVLQLLLDKACREFGKSWTKEYLNKANESGETPLHRACNENHLDMVKLLLEYGTKESVNKFDKYGTNPLCSACINNNIEIVGLLLECGANIYKGCLDYSKDKPEILEVLNLAIDYRKAEEKKEFILNQIKKMEITEKDEQIEQVEKNYTEENILFLIRIALIDAFKSNDALLVKEIFSKINFDFDFINYMNADVIKYAIARNFNDKSGTSIIDAIMTHDFELRYMPYILERYIYGNSINEEFNNKINLAIENIIREDDESKKKMLVNIRNSGIVIKNLSGEIGLKTSNVKNTKKRFKIHELPLDVVGQIMAFAGTDFGERIDHCKMSDLAHLEREMRLRKDQGEQADALMREKEEFEKKEKEEKVEVKEEIAVQRKRNRDDLERGDENRDENLPGHKKSKDK